MDIRLHCRSCGEEFNFTEGEQKFYKEKGLQPPRRCKACRDADTGVAVVRTSS